MATASDEGRPLPLPSIGRRAGAFAAVALLALLAGAAVFAYQLIQRPPDQASVEAGFLRDMSDHHAQAIEMALILHDRTADAELQTMTIDIAMTQQGQIGMMQGWLDLWNLSPTGDDPAMAWMDHPVADGLMPGMATAEEIEQLRTLPADQAEIHFLQLMIRHHQGGVQMARALLERSDQDEVATLARSIVASQQREIDAMNTMLQARGQAPITDPLPTEDVHEDQ